MLPTSLLTNEVKDKAGAEVEFEHLSLEGRVHIYRKKADVPSNPTILKVAHQETGTGVSRVRRSQVRVDLGFTGKSGKPCVSSCYKVFVVPEGELDNYDVIKDASAMLDSFCCTTGAAAAVLFDGSGNGDSAGINGTV